MQKICEKKKKLQIFCVYFIKFINIFDIFVAKILHPSKQSLSQIEYNEKKL